MFKCLKSLFLMKISLTFSLIPFAFLSFHLASNYSTFSPLVLIAAFPSFHLVSNCNKFLPLISLLPLLSEIFSVLY